MVCKILRSHPDNLVAASEEKEYEGKRFFVLDILTAEEVEGYLAPLASVVSLASLGPT